MRISLLLCVILICLTIGNLHAQRSFIDAPSFYLLSRDVENIDADTGIGIDIGYGIGSHHLMAKVSGGLETTTNLGAEKFTDEIRWTPFLRAEVGAGLWRTNSSNCGNKRAMAFTAMPKLGVQYAFNTDAPTFNDGLNYYMSIELALFRLLDYRKNGEYFLETGYFMSDGPAFLKIGTRHFINTKG